MAERKVEITHFPPVVEQDREKSSVRPGPETCEIILARLEGLPGLNVSRGLSALHCNAEKYLGLLRRFVESHIEDMTRLEQSLSENDYVSAQRLVHTLKGTGATLGADALAEAAEALLGCLRSDTCQSLSVQDVRHEMDDIRGELMALADVLPPLSIEASQEADLPDEETVKSIFNELDTLLAQSDTNAITFFEENSSVLRTTLGVSCNELGRQIKAFSFEAARETLRDLCTWVGRG